MSDEIVQVDTTEVTKWLDKVALSVRGRALVRALSAAGNVIADKLEQNTPVRATESYGGNSLDRGVLRENVRVDIQLDSRLRGGTVIVSHGKYSYVANFLEYGHRIVGHGKLTERKSLNGGVGGFVKPNPFVRLTAEEIYEKAAEVFWETLTAELQGDGLADTESVA